MTVSLAASNALALAPIHRSSTAKQEKPS